MASRPRFVLDANVIVSALLLRKSTARQALDQALNTGDILLSMPVIEELYDVLRRTDFDRYVSENDRLQFLTTFVHDAVMVEINERITACRDPKDDKYLELALSGNADLIISGDKDLLGMESFRGIPILSLPAFLNR